MNTADNVVISLERKGGGRMQLGAGYFPLRLTTPTDDITLLFLDSTLTKKKVAS